MFRHISAIVKTAGLALANRHRVIVYAQTSGRGGPTDVWAWPIKWQGKISIRSSGNIYNQSLLTGIISAMEKKSYGVGGRIVANMARKPQGNDRAES